MRKLLRIFENLLALWVLVAYSILIIFYLQTANQPYQHFPEKVSNWIVFSMASGVALMVLAVFDNGFKGGKFVGSGLLFSSSIILFMCLGIHKGLFPQGDLSGEWWRLALLIIVLIGFLAFFIAGVYLFFGYRPRILINRFGKLLEV